MTGPEIIDAQAGELTVLFPALAAALSRDSAPPDGRSALTGGGVVNTDVLHAMIVLRREVPAACHRAAGLCGEARQRRPPESGLGTCLRAVPRFHGRLTSLGLLADAGVLESGLGRWLRVTKLALGLRTPDVPLGYDCPLHAEPSPLVVAGAEGFLGAGGRSVAWQAGGVIRCVLCGESWPASRWLHLGRILQDAG